MFASQMEKLHHQKQSLIILLLVLIPLGGISQSFDYELLKSINVDRPTQLDPTFEFISSTASITSMAVPSAVFGVGLIQMDFGMKRKGLYIAEAMAVNVFITYGLKYSIQRERPYIEHLDIENLKTESSYAFPSGHTSNAFASATSLSLAFPRWYVIAPSMLWATSVGYSRMHIGVHYPSDVFAGAVIGAGCAYLTHWLNKKVLNAPSKPRYY